MNCEVNCVYLFTWSAVLRSSLTFKNFLTCAIVNRDEQRMYFRTSSLTGGSWSELSLKQNEVELIHVVHFLYKPRLLTAILKRSSRRAAEHHGYENLAIYASEKFWLPGDRPPVRPSVSQHHKCEVSHFLSGMGVCNLCLT